MVILLRAGIYPPVKRFNHEVTKDAKKKYFIILIFEELEGIRRA